MSLIELQGVVQRYREERSGIDHAALRADELCVAPGEILMVVGPNGCGKSTLLSTLAFLKRPDEGRILFEGRDPWAEGDALDIRRQCPMLLQESVLFSTNVLENVAKGLRFRGVPRAAARQRALEALELVDMEPLSHRRHDELSGGERRRVAVAQILALRSRVIVLDEPTASLDRDSERLIERLIEYVNREHGTTVVMASHVYRQAVTIATRIVTLIEGTLIEAHLDNVYSGDVTRTGRRHSFRTAAGWELTVEPDMLADDLRRHPVRTRAQLAIPSAAVRLQKPGEPPGPLSGTVDAVRQRGDRCRIRIQLDDGPRIHALVSMAFYRDRGLGLTRRVTMRLTPGSVWLLPPAGARVASEWERRS